MATGFQRKSAMSNKRNQQQGKASLGDMTELRNAIRAAQAIDPPNDDAAPLPCSQTENERLFYLWGDVWLEAEIAWIKAQKQAAQTAEEAFVALCEKVEERRRCPRCWGARKGIGSAYSTNGRTRYYKCIQSLLEDEDGCGMTWNHVFKTSVVMLDDATIEVHRVSQVNYKS